MAHTLETVAPGARATRPVARGARLADPETASARRAGGPQDKALYSCACGHAFKAAVSTSVGCPRCGSRQPW
jgi:hypothetical protein